MVGNDDDLLAVPDFGFGSELALKDTDGSGSADVVGHQDIGLDPHVIPRFDRAFTRRPGQNFFS